MKKDVMNEIAESNNASGGNMLKDVGLGERSQIERECLKALKRINVLLIKPGDCGYFKIKQSDKGYVINRYNSNKELVYVLGYVDSIEECVRYINTAYRVMLYEG